MALLQLVLLVGLVSAQSNFSRQIIPNFYEVPSAVPEDVIDPFIQRYGTNAKILYDQISNPEFRIEITRSFSVETQLGVLVFLYYEEAELYFQVTGFINCYNEVSEVQNDFRNDPFFVIDRELIETAQNQISFILGTVKVLKIDNEGDGVFNVYLINESTNIGKAGIKIDTDISLTSVEFLELGDFLLPQVLNKVNVEKNEIFEESSVQNVRYENNRDFIIFDFETFSVSAEFVNCEFLINQIVEFQEGVYNYNADPDFFEYYTKLKPQLKIENLPPLKRVSRRIVNGIAEYNIQYQITPTTTTISNIVDMVVSFNVVNEDPQIINIIIEQDSILPEINQVIDTITTQPPRNIQTNFTFSIFMPSCEENNEQEKQRLLLERIRALEESNEKKDRLIEELLRQTGQPANSPLCEEERKQIQSLKAQLKEKDMAAQQIAVLLLQTSSQLEKKEAQFNFQRSSYEQKIRNLENLLGRCNALREQIISESTDAQLNLIISELLEQIRIRNIEIQALKQSAENRQCSQTDDPKIKQLENQIRSLRQLNAELSSVSQSLRKEIQNIQRSCQTESFKILGDLQECKKGLSDVCNCEKEIDSLKAQIALKQESAQEIANLFLSQSRQCDINEVKRQERIKQLQTALNQCRN